MNSLENKQHFSLRKLSVGLASVMIGLSFFSAENKIVKADTIGNDNSANIETVNQKVLAKTETQIDSDVQNNSQIDKTRANSDQTAVSTGESDKNNVVNNPAIQNNSNKANAVDANPEATNSSINTEATNSSINTEATNSSINTEAKPNTQSLLKANLNTATVKTKVLNKNMINSNVLSESKVETVTPDYTPAIDAWTGSVDSQGYYELTGYDASKDSNLQNNGIFSIPNAADFEKAGKSTNGHQVGIMRNDIHAIFKANANKIKDLHFSDTDNQKIKAIDSDWSYAFSLRNYDDGNKSANIQKVTGNGFDTSNITNMFWMFCDNKIGDLAPVANWKVDNVTNMGSMFYINNISDLTPLANWKVDNVTDMDGMLGFNQISDLTPLVNWKVNNVTDIGYMFKHNQISNLTPISNWKVDNVTTMYSMFEYNNISDLTPLANWKVDNVTNMNSILKHNNISDLTPLANWKVDNVTNMNSMFSYNNISDLTPLTNWNVNNVTDMRYMFFYNNISDLTPISNWKVDNVTNMNGMFADNKISNLIPLSNWKIDNVTNMNRMFSSNPIKYADFSKWNFNAISNKPWSWSSDTGLTNFINSSYLVIYLGDNTTLPNWVLDYSNSNSDQIFSDPNHTIIITTDPKLLANPNKSFNTITITDQDGTVKTYQTPVFINATSVEEAKKIIKQDIKDQINAYNTANPNRTVALDTSMSTNIDDPLNGLAYLANTFYTAKHNTKAEIDYNPAKRTITIHNLDGTVSTYVQTIGYKRDKITDLVTNNVTYGTYALDDPTSSYTINGVAQTAKSYRQDGSTIYFASIKIPVIPGYKAVMKSNNGIMAVSYRLLALPKQDLDPIKMAPTSDNKTTILPVHSTVTITQQWKEQYNSIIYDIKKDNLNVIVPKLDNYEFHLTNSKQNTLAFTYANSTNTYKFSLSYDSNGHLILHVENKDLNQAFIIKSQDSLLKLIKSIIK